MCVLMCNKVIPFMCVCVLMCVGKGVSLSDSLRRKCVGMKQVLVHTEVRGDVAGQTNWSVSRISAFFFYVTSYLHCLGHEKFR